jgi:hypothetical protein
VVTLGHLTAPLLIPVTFFFFECFRKEKLLVKKHATLPFYIQVVILRTIRFNIQIFYMVLTLCYVQTSEQTENFTLYILN